MTRITFLPLLGVLALTPLFAQPAVADCSEGSARTAPGTWKPTPDSVESSDIISKSQMPDVRKEMSGYADLLRTALGGNTGHVARWNGTFGGRLFANGPAKQQVNVTLFRFECEDGKLVPEGEHSEWASVGINTTWSMSGPEARSVIGGKKYYPFGSPIGQIRGFPAFQTDYEGMGRVTSWVVLVERPGRKAFHMATVQELLDSLKAQADAERAQLIADMDRMNPIRPAAEQQKEKEHDLALFLKGAKDDAQRQHWIERFEKDYRNDEQKRDEARRKATKDSDKVLARLAAVRARFSPEQLAQTAMSHPSAITRVWDDFDFKKTHEEACGKGICGDGWGRPFGIPAQGYYDPADSPARPQFFTVTFEWAQGTSTTMDPAIEKLRDDFFARFDFDALVARLGR